MASTFNPFIPQQRSTAGLSASMPAPTQINPNFSATPSTYQPTAPHVGPVSAPAPDPVAVAGSPGSGNAPQIAGAIANSDNGFDFNGSYAASQPPAPVTFNANDPSTWNTSETGINPTLVSNRPPVPGRPNIQQDVDLYAAGQSKVAPWLNNAQAQSAAANAFQFGGTPTGAQDFKAQIAGASGQVSNTYNSLFGAAYDEKAADVAGQNTANANSAAAIAKEAPSLANEAASRNSEAASRNNAVGSQNQAIVAQRAAGVAAARDPNAFLNAGAVAANGADRRTQGDASGGLLQYANQGPGPSAAQAQLANATNANTANALALARSGHGNSQASLRQAIGANAGIQQTSANQSAQLSAQENQAYQQNRIAALNGAGAIATNARAGDTAVGQYTSGVAATGQAQNDATALGYGNQAQGYGREAQAYGTEAQGYGKEAQGYGTEAQNWGQQGATFANTGATYGAQAQGATTIANQVAQANQGNIYAGLGAQQVTDVDQMQAKQAYQNYLLSIMNHDYSGQGSINPNTGGTNYQPWIQAGTTALTVAAALA